MHAARPDIDVRRSASRFVTEAEGRTTRHSFSFDRHYDPDNVGFGPLLAVNDDLLQPGHGYPRHRHQDTEIVSWVLEGVLRHEDSAGHSHDVPAGSVQRLCAGTGVEHAETCPQGGGPVRFVQMWLRPAAPGLTPAYASASPAADVRGWVPLASGVRREAAVPLSTPGASLLVARLPAGETLEVPPGPLIHLHLTRGRAELEGAGPLDAGDTVRLTERRSDFGPRRLTAAAPGTEVLAWVFSG